jgi:hypothetical protein
VGGAYTASARARADDSATHKSRVLRELEGTGAATGTWAELPPSRVAAPFASAKRAMRDQDTFECILHTWF